MTVRGGGVPACVMAFVPRKRMGSAASELRCRCAWLQHGSGPWTHRIQGCGAIDPRDRKRAPLRSSFRPETILSAAVLEAVQARPGNDGVRRHGGATAGLDSFCARRHWKPAVGAEESLRRGRTKERAQSKKVSQQERKRLRSWRRLENERMLAARVEQKNGAIRLRLGSSLRQRGHFE